MPILRHEPTKVSWDGSYLRRHVMSTRGLQALTLTIKPNYQVIMRSNGRLGIHAPGPLPTDLPRRENRRSR